MHFILVFLLLMSCINFLMNDTEEKDKVESGDVKASEEGKGYKELPIEDKYSDNIIKIMDIPNGVSDLKIVGNKLYYSISNYLEKDPYGVFGIMDITEPDNPKNLKVIGDISG